MTVATMGADLERSENQRQDGVLQKLAHDDATRAEIARVLPPSVPLDRFERAARTAILQNAELAECEQGSLFRSLVKCAMDGLLPDGREAALVAYYNNKTKQKEAQYLPMIFGVRKIAGEAGWTIHTFVVYENDQFEVDLGGGLPIHRPAPLNAARGEMIGAWAKATHRDGRAAVVEVMRREDIKRSQAVSKTGEKEYSPWKTWTDRMWEKTVGHRIAKKLPLDADDRERLERVIDAVDAGPRAAAEALYGAEAGASFAELPAGVHESPKDVTDPDATSSFAPGDDGGRGPEPQPGPAATPDEGEPVVVIEDPAADPAAIKQAADAAALFIPPNGQFAQGGELGPKSLAEILALGEQGEKWLRWALGKVTTPPEFADAVWAFAAVYAPEMHQQAAARKAA